MDRQVYPLVGSLRPYRVANFQKEKKKGMRKYLIDIIRWNWRAYAEGSRTIAIKFAMFFCHIYYRFRSGTSPDLNLSLDLVGLFAFFQDPNTGSRA